MEFSAQQHKQITRVKVCGDVTIFEAEQFLQALQQNLNNCERLVLNLVDVEEFDTSGLQVLVSLKQTLSAKSLELVIEDPSDTVSELLVLMGQQQLLGGQTDG